jgi:lipoate-protein ligase A
MLIPNNAHYIINNNIEPYFNLALEEYLLKETDRNYFMLWRNEPCVVVGRNQDTIAEINFSYIKAHDIKVIRRLSGGGAVFHDSGNFNFTFITNNTEGNLYNFSKFTTPIIEVLNTLGIMAKLSKRNDLVMAITGHKFSGNAQCTYKGRLLHHGTILFNVDIDVMTVSLTVSCNNPNKGVRSVSSCVTNIHDHLPQRLTAKEFEVMIRNHIISKQNYTAYHLTSVDIATVIQLVTNKYSTWAWNYGTWPINS